MISALKPRRVLVVMDDMWNDHESRSREQQVKFHELAPPLARTEVEKAGFEITFKSATHSSNELIEERQSPDPMADCQFDPGTGPCPNTNAADSCCQAWV